MDTAAESVRDDRAQPVYRHETSFLKEPYAVLMTASMADDVNTGCSRDPARVRKTEDREENYLPKTPQIDLQTNVLRRSSRRHGTRHDSTALIVLDRRKVPYDTPSTHPAIRTRSR